MPSTVSVQEAVAAVGRGEIPREPRIARHREQAGAGAHRKALGRTGSSALRSSTYSEKSYVASARLPAAPISAPGGAGSPSICVRACSVMSAETVEEVAGWTLFTPAPSPVVSNPDVVVAYSLFSLACRLWGWAPREEPQVGGRPQMGRRKQNGRRTRRLVQRQRSRQRTRRGEPGRWRRGHGGNLRLLPSCLGLRERLPGLVRSDIAPPYACCSSMDPPVRIRHPSRHPSSAPFAPGTPPTPAQDIMGAALPTSWPSGGTTSARCGPCGRAKCRTWRLRPAALITSLTSASRRVDRDHQAWAAPRAACRDVLAYFDRPGTGNGLTDHQWTA